MKRSAVLGAALTAAAAAVFAVGVARASASPLPNTLVVYASIADGQAGEGQAGTLKLSLVKPRTTTVFLSTHVFWSTVGGGTATLGTDYAAQNGMLTLSPTQLSGDIPVKSLDDNIYQPDHTFKVLIWSPDPWVVITRDTATFTIHDNDTQPTAHIGDQAPSWVYAGGDLTWTVSLSNPSYQPVTVSLDGGVNRDSTLLPADYDGTVPTSVTVPAYQSSGWMRSSASATARASAGSTGPGS